MTAALSPVRTPPEDSGRAQAAQPTPLAPERTLKERVRLPLLMRIAKWMIRHDVRGGYRLLERSQSALTDDDVVRMPLRGGRSVVVPSRILPIDEEDFANYEADVVRAVASAVTDCARLLLIDGGAHCGIMSAKLVEAIPAIRSVVAIEPNSAVRPYLSTNLARLGVEWSIVPAAVSDFHGKGSLRYYFTDDPCSIYMQQDDQGDIDVVRVSDLPLPQREAFVLKLDVEGHEKRAIDGAADLIRSADVAVVVFEVHAAHIERLKEDQFAAIDFILGVRPGTIRIAERGNQPLDRSRSLADQTGGLSIVNLVYRTNDRATAA